jgi:tetratricopeptide (TPR) repeat protein
LLKLDRHQDAAVVAERACELDPSHGDTRAALAGVYLRIGRYADAAREYRRLLDGGRNTPELLLALARAEWELGNSAAAIELCDRVFQWSPEHPGALGLRALIRFRSGDYQRALADLERIRGADANGELVLYHRAQSLDRLGRGDEAQRVYSRLAAVQNAERFTTDALQRPDDLALQVRAAEAWLAAGDPGAAARQIEHAMARLGPSRAALLVFADCHDAMGKPDLARKARADAERAP